MKPHKVDAAKAREYFANKMHFTTGPVELKRWLEEKENINIVDVRRAEDYEKGHIPGAVNLPKEKWDGLEGLAKNRVNVLYCYSQTCHLAPEAAMIFADKGFPVMELEGGFDVWQKSKFPVQALAPAGHHRR